MKLSWDDIPALEGLGMDWDYESTSALDKRSFIRLTDKDISGLFEVNEVLANIATDKQIYSGRLIDISAGGMLLSLPALIEPNLAVKVCFFLGTVKVLSRGVTRHSSKRDDWYLTGIQFLDLKKETAEYIAGLYASKVLYLAH